MKTTFLKTGACALMTILLLGSCQKEVVNKPNSTINNPCNLSVIENRLVFNTISDYEGVVSLTNSEQTVAFTKQVNSLSNFTSYSEKQNTAAKRVKEGSALDSLLDGEDFLKSILNPDGAVQIGNYIILLDLANDLVYVIDAKFSDQYSDLVARNTNNPNIMVFSTEDEVIELLKEGVFGTVKNINNTLAKAKCKEKKARARKDDDNILYGNNQYRLNCLLKYKAFGISHKLFVRLLNQTKFLGTWILQDGYLWIDYNASWKERCGGTGSASQICSTNDCSVPARQLEYFLYSSTRNLTNFSAIAVFHNRAALISSRTFNIQYP